MKKTLLFALCAAMLGSAGAQAAPARAKEQAKIAASRLPGVPTLDEAIHNPEGSDELWIMNVTENTYFGDEDVDGYKMLIRRSADGSTIYFRDLTPGFNGDDNVEYSWVKGSVEGNDITVEAGQVLYKTDIQALYLEAVTVDEWGQVQDFLPEVHFTIEGDKIVQADNSIRVSVFDNAETMEEAGFFIFMNNFEMQPMGEVEACTPPDGLPHEQWMLTADTGSRFVDVVRDGSDFYVAGLSTMAPDDYVKGSLADGTLTFRSGSILLSHPTRYLRLIGASPAGTDEWGYPLLEMTMSFSLAANADATAFTMQPAEDFIAEASYFNFTMLNGCCDVRMFQYAGDVAATPATPEIVEWNEEDGILRINVPCADINGNFINPALLTYRIYLDGEPHVLSPDEYYALPGEMTDIPYDFSDQYDIYSNGDLKTIFLHAPEFSRIEAESTYTVDGDARTSARAQLSGVEAGVAEAEVTGVYYTDMLGRRVAAPAAGSLLLRHSTRADGSVSVDKQLFR